MKETRVFLKRSMSILLTKNSVLQIEQVDLLEQGNLRTRKVCLLLKVRRPVPTRSMKKSFHGEPCSSNRSGQPDITPSVIRAHNLSENIRVEQIHDRSGKPDERNSSSAHTVKEQHAPEVHREIALLNTDNEFNREINEEDINFKIPGLPHYIVKHAQSTSVRELIQKIENHPNRHVIRQDLRQSQSFNPFSPE